MPADMMWGSTCLQVPQLQLVHSDVLRLNLPELLDSLASSAENR